MGITKTTRLDFVKDVHLDLLYRIVWDSLLRLLRTYSSHSKPRSPSTTTRSNNSMPLLWLCLRLGARQTTLLHLVRLSTSIASDQVSEFKLGHANKATAYSTESLLQLKGTRAYQDFKIALQVHGRTTNSCWEPSKVQNLRKFQETTCELRWLKTALF